GAIDSRADLRTRFLDVDDSLPRLLARSQLFLELRDLLRSTREQGRVVDATSFRRKLRRGHVFLTHQQRRCEVNELRALVRAVIEHLGDLQLGLPNTNAIADACIELTEQPRLEPR